MIEKLLAVGLSNAIVVVGLAIIILAATRIWRHAPLAHALWLIVLVKFVTPPVFNFDVVIPVASGGAPGGDATFMRNVGTDDGDAPRAMVAAASRRGAIDVQSDADTSSDPAEGLRKGIQNGCIHLSGDRT